MDNLETLLDRWQSATIIDLSTAERIRRFESEREPRKPWGVIVAVVFGCVMVGAGVLLFVAAHWEDLSPTNRFLLVISKVALFHALGAVFANRSRYLSMALHAIGTIALGAGIFLAGQIFNLDEHWPGGIMLWAIGAAFAWWLLRDWAQGALVAILVPFWLVGEWEVRVSDAYRRGDHIAAAFVLLLALTYLGAVEPGARHPLRRALMWLGGLAFFPAVFWASLSAWENVQPEGWRWFQRYQLPVAVWLGGWLAAILLPLAFGYLLRPARLLWQAGAAVWVLGLSAVSRYMDPEKNILVYLWCLLGCVAMIWWGVDDRRKERINLGMAAFGITLLTFYFSSVLDKFGRSTALISMGLIFLVGGYYMERLRRRLVSQVTEASR
jgi:uncharacterized membrane protein